MGLHFAVVVGWVADAAQLAIVVICNISFDLNTFLSFFMAHVRNVN